MMVCSFQILIRWSLPRFRYDQVLAFAWKFMLPLALLNLASPPCWCGRTREAPLMKTPYKRKQYWNEPTLGAWERAYLPEILRGLVITSGVFLRNMTTLDHRQEGRADDLLPGGDALRLRTAATAASMC